MDYGQILRRSWQITWKYKFLWVFGIALALCRSQGGGGGNFNFGNNFGGQDNLDREMPISPADLGRLEQFINSPTFLAIVVGLIIFILLLTILSIAVGAFARGALVRSVNRIENGETLDFRQAWEEGKRSFRPIFWFELLLSIPLLVVGLAILGGVLLLVYNLWQSGVFDASLPSTPMLERLLTTLPVVVVVLCGLICLAVILQLLVAIFTVFGSRAIALEGYGVSAGFGRAWRVFSQNLAPILLFALILFGISLGVGILIAIPLALFFGVVIALVFGIAASGIWPLLIVLFGGVFLVVLIISSFIGGLYSVFSETLWTLVYRQLVGLAPKVSDQNVASFGAPELTPP